jgi:Na+-transporting NADH:ubiquinone oxidoreductase subunit D
VTLQILGICSALAVTTSLDTALTMSVSLTVVVVLSALVISIIRRQIPDSIRLIVQIVIVASLVIVIDQVLQAYFFGISQRLSVFVSLITTNCLVLGRTESFARNNPPIRSMIDALGNGLGYSLVLIVIGGTRELFGAGSLLGHPILPTMDQGGWFQPLNLMLLAPSAFFLLGGLVWAIRSIRSEQVEAREFGPPEPAETKG